MPIPQLNNKKKQSWRFGRKKYFLNRGENHDLKSSQAVEEYATADSSTGKKKKNNRNKFWRFLLFAFLGVVLLGFITLAWLSRGLPDPNRLMEREVAQSTKIYDRNGETVLYEIHGDQKRTLVSLKDMPDYVKWATIAIEDKDFYNHGGFSLWAIGRTVITNVLFHKKAGGSTLTQQFIKNAVLTSEKTYTRKIKELLLAYKVEKRFSKDEILQMYLNEIPYGSTAYGVDAASQRYFGKSVRDINLAEAAILAALPQAPSRYSPFGTNKDQLINRQHYILDLMVKQGFIKTEEAEAAKNAPLEFKKEATNILAPHFVMYVKEILSEKYGEKMVEQGGLKIYTTLDLYKQKIAEEAINEYAPKNKDKYDASNAALVSIDPKTGQILAMVGSKDYFDDEIDGQVNITLSSRQPGSSLKPLVYAAAFLKGYTPNTILYDVVTNFSSDPAKAYEPHNYDNQEHGPVAMKKALGGSLNIPAVKTIYLAGVDNVLDLAHELGYTTLTDRDRYGLSLVLGGGEVKLVEHANAYSAFAREGMLHPVTPILKVLDKDGKLIEEFNSPEKNVLEPNVAREINDILSDNSNRSWIFGEKNWLTLGSRPVAAKTGTTNDYRDAWTIGYTPSLVAGVWVGNNDNSPMKRGADGSMLAAPIWNTYMKKVLGDTPVESFKEPAIPKTGKPMLDGQSGADTVVKIDKVTGLLATELTPPELIEEKLYFKPHSILYYVNKNDPLGPAPSDPAADPQFNLWENRVLAWAEKEKAATSTEFTEEKPPTEFDNVHTADNVPTLEIITPANNQKLTESLLTVRINTEAKRGIKRVEYYINGNLLESVSEYPYNLDKQIDFLNNGFHNLKVRACDDVDNCASKEVEIDLSLANNTNSGELKVTLESPTSGLAVSNIDFPLPIKVNLTDIKSVSQLNFYYVTSDKKQTLISKVEPVNNNEVTIFWADIPVSGTYKVFAEAKNWTKNDVKTPEVSVIVNNISEKTAEKK